MLIPNVHVLRDLRARYVAAQRAHAEDPGESTLLALENVSYTLCVLTATTAVPAALAAADRLLARAAITERKQRRAPLAA